MTDRASIREALAAHAVSERIGRKLCDELIAAARLAVAAYDLTKDGTGSAERRRTRQLWEAMKRLEELVGRP